MPPHGAFLGEDAVAQPGVQVPDLSERLPDGCEGRLDGDPPAARRVRGEGSRQGDGHRHQATRRPRARVAGFWTVAALTQTTGGKPSAISFHDEPALVEPNSLPLRVPK